jgi:chromosome segregation ATPase
VQVNKKGAMTGGFHDPKRSRLRAMREVKNLTGGLGTARDGLAAARARLAELDAEVNRALSAHEKAAKRHQAAVAETEAMRAEQAELAHNAATWAQQLESKQRLVRRGVVSRRVVRPPAGRVAAVAFSCMPLPFPAAASRFLAVILKA